MKNAMKKLMSLLLVAVLLVSAVPFAASAAEVPVTIYQEVDGKDEVKPRTYSFDDERANIADICAYFGITEEDFEGAWCTTDQEWEKSYSDSIPADCTLKIRKKAITTTPADPDPVAPIKVVVKVNDSDNVVWEGTKVPTNGEYALVKNLLTYCWNSSWTGVYEFSHAYRYALDGTKGYTEGQDAKIKAGEEVHIMLKEKAPKVDDTDDSTGGSTGGGVVDDEFMNDIWLYIYTNNDLISPAKRVLLNDYTIVKDYKLNKAEALTVVDDYYKATNSNDGIIWKGMYREVGDITALQFITGNGRDDTIDKLDVLRSNDTVIIKVRVTGVTAKSSGTADSSNPKTGDNIFMAVSVMGVSAAALATAFYFYNKKRKAI